MSRVSALNDAILAIEAQQPKERTAVWMVGEQLKDILRGEPHLAELVVQDLDGTGMTLAECEKQIKAFADKHKTGDFACVTPAEAEDIIREFYGLGKATEVPATAPQRPRTSGKLLNLEDFL